MQDYDNAVHERDKKKRQVRTDEVAPQPYVYLGVPASVPLLTPWHR